MDTTIILAEVLGMTYVVLGLSMVLNKRATESAVVSLVENKGVTWLAGLVTLLLGSFMLSLNNVWTSGLPLYITILGWLTFIKGSVIILFPDFAHSYYKKINQGSVFFWGGIAVILIGLALLCGSGAFK